MIARIVGRGASAMGMIRRAEVERAAREALVMNLGDIAREGERHIASARAEAERILAEARAERDRLIAGAREEGHRLGYEKGLEEGRASGLEEGRNAALVERGAALAGVVASWQEAIGAFEASRIEMIGALRRDALSLAVAVAERVARRTIASDALAVLAQMDAALSLLARESRITVAISPEDEPIVREAMPALVSKFAEVTHTTLVCDPRVERGGCIIRTDAGGTIDATIRTQIERLAGAIGVNVVSPQAGAPGEPSESADGRDSLLQDARLRDASDKRHAA